MIFGEGPALRSLRFFLFGLLVALMAARALPFHSCGAVPLRSDARPPAVAGQFYPAAPAELAARIDGFTAAATLPVDLPPGRLLAVISPHAGYDYSGPVAGYAYALAARRAAGRRVILLGLSHHTPLEGAMIDPRLFVTPLGDVPFDESLGYDIRLKAGPGIAIGFEPAGAEHSLEVQVPLLQRALPGLSLVPITIGSTDPGFRDRLAAALADVLARHPDALLAVSTDMSHFHPDAAARAMDAATIDAIARLDVDALGAGLDGGRFELCGQNPVLVALLTLKKMGVPAGRLLKYQNSGDTTGDRSAVVGYSAWAFFAPGTGEVAVDMKPETHEKVKSEGLLFSLDAGQKAEVLKIARTTLEAWVRDQKVPPYRTDDAKLNTKCGAFVTLKLDGELRGCIGYVQAVEPLWKSIQDMAVNASTKDPRFPPVTPAELARITIEISVLSPLERCDDVNKIIVGTHGIVIKKGWNSGLLLPQVAVEEKWDRLTFLEHTCWKAGLPPDAWKSGAEILIFSAQVFGEE